MEKVKIKGITFILGDCMEYLKELPDNAYDLAIVDPPYGIERFKKAAGSTRFKSSDLMQKKGLTWDNKPKKQYFDRLFLKSNNQIIWGANNFTLPESEYFCIWDKKQTVPNFARCELAFVSKGLKKPAKIFEYSIHKHNHTNKIHPTQKPVQLYKWLLKNYAEPGQSILDTHGGSGSIAIACHELGHPLTIIEKDKEYFDNMIKRFKEQTAQLSLGL